MKLWILRPIDNDPLWDPWFDKAFGFVIRAETEADARAIAHGNAGDENRYGKAWLDATHSTCMELSEDGPQELVMEDFAAA